MWKLETSNHTLECSVKKPIHTLYICILHLCMTPICYWSLESKFDWLSLNVAKERSCENMMNQCVIQ